MSSQTHRFAPARWQSLRLPFGLTATGPSPGTSTWL
jgi:hypothetical protein